MDSDVPKSGPELVWKARKRGLIENDLKGEVQVGFLNIQGDMAVGFHHTHTRIDTIEAMLKALLRHSGLSYDDGNVNERT